MHPKFPCINVGLVRKAFWQKILRPKTRWFENASKDLTSYCQLMSTYKLEPVQHEAGLRAAPTHTHMRDQRRKNGHHERKQKIETKLIIPIYILKHHIISMVLWKTDLYLLLSSLFSPHRWACRGSVLKHV